MIEVVEQVREETLLAKSNVAIEHDKSGELLIDLATEDD